MTGLITIVPTRGRPEAARALADEYARTKTGDDTDLIFGIDDDDPLRTEYAHHMIGAPGAPLMRVGPRVRMGPTLNHLATQWASRHFDVVGFMGDDHRTRTKGWDEDVIRVLQAEPGVAYGDDGIHGPNLPTAVWISASIIRSLGYMAPPGLTHLYLDNFWLELGRATNLHYLPHLSIEHLHPIAGKAEWDAGYVAVNSGEMQAHDHTEYQRYMREDWLSALARVIIDQ